MKITIPNEKVWKLINVHRKHGIFIDNHLLKILRAIETFCDCLTPLARAIKEKLFFLLNAFYQAY